MDSKPAEYENVYNLNNQNVDHSFFIVDFRSKVIQKSKESLCVEVTNQGSNNKCQEDFDKLDRRRMGKVYG